MVYQLKTLVILTILAFTALYFFKEKLLLCMSEDELKRYKWAWFWVTAWSLFAPSVWPLMIGMAAIVFKFKSDDAVANIGLFFVTCFAIPNVYLYVYLGPITLIKLDTVVICSLVTLVPLLWSSLKKFPLFSIATDKYVLAYFVTVFILDMRASSTTEVMREFLANFFRYITPYIVVSRNIETIRDHHRLLGAIMFAFCVFTLVCAYESIIKQYLYTITKFKYRLVHPVMLVGNYRAGFLRAMGPIASPISLGIFLSFLIVITLYLSNYTKKSLKGLSSLFLAIFSLIFTFSRGSWMGAIATSFLFTLKNEKAFAKFFKLGAWVVFALVAISFTPYIEKVEELIPSKFKGEEASRTDTFDYRERLMENSIIVIKENPVFGNPNFMSHPSMEEMKQGQGIIDVVNTYLAVVLNYGFVGLSLYLLAILPNMISAYFLSQKLPEAYSVVSRYAKMIAFNTLGLLIMIYNMSPLSYLPVYIWVLVAIQASLVRLLVRAAAEKTKPKTLDPNSTYTDSIFESAMRIKKRAN